MLTKEKASQEGLYFIKPRRWGLIVCAKNRSNRLCQCQLTSSTSVTPILLQRRVMGRNKIEELCLLLASCLSTMTMAIKSECSDPTPPQPLAE